MRIGLGMVERIRNENAKANDLDVGLSVKISA
jgi:hypothetical protein